MPEPVARSALFHRDAATTGDGAAQMAEQPLVGKLILRGEHADVAPSLRHASGVVLPDEPCTSARKGAYAALWLGPDEWMILTEEGAEDEAVAWLDEALSDVPHQVARVSDHYTLISLSGERVREMLGKLVTLDLHPRGFREGQVKGTMMGAAQTYIWQSADDARAGGPEFRILVRRSFADYAWGLLAEAGRGYGLPLQEPLGGERLTI